MAFVGETKLLFSLSTRARERERKKNKSFRCFYFPSRNWMRDSFQKRRKKISFGWTLFSREGEMDCKKCLLVNSNWRLLALRCGNSKKLKIKKNKDILDTKVFCAKKKLPKNENTWEWEENGLGRDGRRKNACVVIRFRCPKTKKKSAKEK